VSFQGKNRDWDGKQLKVDGLVGPDTSDALNRAMVGKWYDHYQTPEKLVEGKPYHTATTDHMNSGLLIKPGKAKEGKVFLAGVKGDFPIHEVKMRVCNYNLEPYSQKLCVVSFLGNGKIVKKTDKDGVISFKMPAHSKEWEITLPECDPLSGILGQKFFKLEEDLPPASTVRGSTIRLRNLDYYAGPIVDEMTDLVRNAIFYFQSNEDLPMTGKLDPPTVDKLHDLSVWADTSNSEVIGIGS